MKKYFTKQEAIQDVIETLENGYSGYYEDLHNEVFNTDYYIIGVSEAKEALTEYGVFEAIDEVRQYEYDNFGEYYTDVANPEKLANMLYYIIGEGVITNNDELNQYYDLIADEETNKIIIKSLKQDLESEE